MDQKDTKMMSVIIDDWKATPTYKQVDKPVPKSG